VLGRLDWVYVLEGICLLSDRAMRIVKRGWKWNITDDFETKRNYRSSISR
jgi:hypothetical protein